MFPLYVMHTCRATQARQHLYHLKALARLLRTLGWVALIILLTSCGTDLRNAWINIFNEYVMPPVLRTVAALGVFGLMIRAIQAAIDILSHRSEGIATLIPSVIGILFFTVVALSANTIVGTVLNWVR